MTIKRLFIGALTGCIIGGITGGLFYILAVEPEYWNLDDTRVLLIPCMLPSSIAGLIGAALYKRQASNIELKPKVEESVGENKNLQNASDQKKSEAGLIGAALSEHSPQTSNIELNSKVKEPIENNQNLQEYANDQKASEIGEGIRGGILGGIVLIVVCFILFLIWYQVVIVNGSRPRPQPPGGVVSLDSINVDAPSTVGVGEDMRIQVQFKNLGNKRVELITVRIGGDYFDGFILEDSEPQYNQTHEYENFQSYDFNESILPDETFTIEFNGKALLKGNYLVSIWVCVGIIEDCAATYLRTSIK